MPLARRPASRIRVIAHVDLDCFYVQVEQRRQPQLRGKPTAVIQYNSWKGGACIAVGYEARKCGVKRSMRGDAAKAVCPDLNLVQVPVLHEKADLSIYRDAGSEVVAVLSRVGRCERASIDEVYLDITEAAEKLLSKDLSVLVSEEASKSHIIGIPQDIGTAEWLGRPDASREDRLLACGAIIIGDIRSAVLSETQFTCSAGIAHNKMLAKLTSGMHKPGQQTLVPSSSVESLLATLPISKIGKLGGKLGQELEEDLGIKTVGDLSQYSEVKLQDMYGPNTGTWLWNTARGINGDEVQDRTLPKSHSSGKTFPGPQALRTLDIITHWLTELAETLQLRLDEDLSQNNRVAHHLTVHASCHMDGRPTASKFSSKSRPLRYGVEKIVEDSRCLVERILCDFCSSHSSAKEESKLSSTWFVTGLSLTASNILAKPTGVNPITQYFGTSSHAAFVETSSNLQDEQNGSIERSAQGKSEVKTGDTVFVPEVQKSQGINPITQYFGTSSHAAFVETTLNLQDEKNGSSERLAQGKSNENAAHAPEVQRSPPSRKKPATLSDLWQRKASAQQDRIEAEKKEPIAWDYKEEEIDRGVLSELPHEIQLELKNRLGLSNKRQCKGKLSQFFNCK